jgi:SAM-dependent methyltransferase
MDWVKTLEVQPYTEDLVQLAAAQFRLAGQFCDTCRNYHAVWPYRRLARVVATAEAGAPDFEATLRSLFKSGKSRVLIAGCADAGLLALTARAGAPYGVDIVVLDRCRTPLEVCRQFARQWSLQIDTLHQDLTTLDILDEFDIVFMNSVLLFIAPGLRIEALSRLGRALRQGGRLINVFNAGARVAAEGFTQRVLAEMKRRGSPLPESTEAFVQRLDDYEREYYSRERTLNDLDQILALHRRSGFTIVRCVETDMGVTTPWQRSVAKSVQRRYLIEAECNRGGN